MTYNDGYDEEAIDLARIDVDLEMAEMDAVGNATHRAQKAGVCTHTGGAVAYRSPPVYAEQEGLKPGQIRCVGCKQVYESEDDFQQAIAAAIADYR